MTDTVAYTCQELVEVVTDYLEGGLSQPERLAFERHVGICPPCRGYLAQLRRVVRSAAALQEDEELPPSLREGLLRSFRDWKAERPS
ncbi:MAG TPA: zf-HC2 domain-containing protein [Gaiellaceae bacterium]|nr:zf-HC2 domain-containing protein [Gaiellaceae bacterium]